jgi:IS5 family transposase
MAPGRQGHGPGYVQRGWTIAEEVKDLHEEWMKHADQVLGDKEIVAAIYEALAKRHPQSRTRGRPGTPAEVVLRLLVLKHMRNWSYGVLEREVRANLVYRDFTRVGGTKMPDAKTMGRWGVAVRPVVVKQIHERIVQIARDNRVAQGQSPPFFLASPWGTAAWDASRSLGTVL